jgi:hypothetical protein
VDAYVEAYSAEVDRQASEPPGPGVVKVRQLLEEQRRAASSGRRETP